MKDPGRARAHLQLGNAYLEKQLIPEGIAELQTAVTLSKHNSIFLSALARAYALSGRSSEARAILKDLEALARRQYVPPTALARVYVGLDDTQTAHMWMERAYIEHDIGLVWTAPDIGSASLQSDPTFQDVYSRVGLAP